jgi:hypothetical protein
VIYRSTPTTPPIRVRIIQASFGLFALKTKWHRRHVSEQIGMFADSLLHSSDWDHE